MTHASALGPNDPEMVTAATPPTLLRSACQKSCDLSHNSAHKHVSALVMQALANDMPALAPSSECAIARGMGGASPQAPGVYRGLLLETKKMSQGGLVEDQERPRRSPAKAKSGLWAHSAISRSQSVKPQKSKSAKPAARPPPPFRMLPNTLLTDLANGDFGSASSYVAHAQ